MKRKAKETDEKLKKVRINLRLESGGEPLRADPMCEVIG